MNNKETIAVVENKTQTTNSSTTTPTPVRKKQWLGKRICLLCKKGFYIIDYKDVTFLKKYLKPNNKIVARHMSGNCQKHQKQVSNSIKRARLVALLPFVLE